MNNLGNYKKIIKNSIYPGQCEFTMKAEIAEDVINAYADTNKDKLGQLELMFFFIECFEEFFVDFDTSDEDLEEKVEHVFNKMIKILKNCEKSTIIFYIDKFKELIFSPYAQDYDRYGYMEIDLEEAFPEYWEEA
jgi:hypothetical protein